MYSIFDWTKLAEERYRDPDDESLPLRLQLSQKQILHFFQYGTKIGEPSSLATEVGLILAKRGSGKSTGCEVAATTIAAEVPGSSIGTFATVENNAIELIERMKYFLETSPYEPYRRLKPKRGEGTWSKQEIILPNKSRVRSYTASYKQIIGLHHHYGLIDEASRIDDELIYGAIIPKFSRIGIRWVMLSTPDELSGAFYEFLEMAEKDSRLGKKPRFTVIKMDAIKDGFQSQVKVDFYKSITPEFYNRREYEAEFIMKGGVVFPPEWVEDAMTRSHHPLYNSSRGNANPYSRYCIGVDFGVDTTNTSICVGHKAGKEKIIDYMETFSPPITETHTKTRKRLYGVMGVFPTRLLVPDATGMGNVNIEEIVKALTNARYKCNIYCNKKTKKDGRRLIGYHYDRTSKNVLIEDLQNDYTKGIVVLPYHYDAINETDKGYEMYKLKKELSLFRSEQRGTNKIYGTQKQLDDRVMSLALCCKGLEKFHKYNLVMSRG
jgi:hypothetical protein